VVQVPLAQEQEELMDSQVLVALLVDHQVVIHLS
jgi:hypothetical protein